MKKFNFHKGRHGENLARHHLETKGYQFVASNFHTRYGEIDLIMVNKNKLIFIEVKYKSPSSPGTPEDMISKKKIYQIQRTALAFLQQNPKLADQYPAHRLDAVCLVGDTIKHYVNITL